MESKIRRIEPPTAGRSRSKQIRYTLIRYTLFIF